MNQHDDKNDCVARLRRAAQDWPDTSVAKGELMEEAANRLEQLEREVWSLRDRNDLLSKANHRMAASSHVALPRIPTEEMLDDGAEAYFTTKDKHPPKGPDMATLLTASWTAMYDAAMKAAVPSVTRTWHCKRDSLLLNVGEKCPACGDESALSAEGETK